MSICAVGAGHAESLSRFVVFLMLVSALFAFGGCSDNPDPSDGDADGDSDGDSDGDGDGDSDGDSDGDGDGDSDGDADGDGDGDPPPPACTDAEPPSGDGELISDFEHPISWQPLEVRFVGPAASETDADPNPFLDYRLTVVFVGPSEQTYEVPGFFDGDGEGGESGDVWAARFTPDEGGEWTYLVSFRTGDGVALSLDADAGSAGELDGASGRFCAEHPDPEAPGFLGQGFLRYADEHYLRLDNGDYWIKGGADSPENFLGYAGFDNTVDQSGGASTAGLEDGVHRYEPHVDDWNEGDPDWGDGAGRGIIGALNYLASENVNSIYFLPCNIGGDGRETYPYVAPDDLMHFDISKLHQWEIVFDHAQRLGIALHFVLSETETGNENLHDDGELGPQRMLFYRELSARFGYHPALFWNIGEENDYGAERQREFAGYLRAVDPYDHPLTVHTHANQPEAQYADLVGDDRFDMTSIQLSPQRAGEFTEEWRRRSAETGRPWAVMLDEIGPAGTGVTDTNAGEIRRLTLWPALLSGSGGVEWYFGYHDLPLGGDMRAEDFRTREEMWRFTRIAIEFMHDHLRFWEMEPADSQLEGESGGDGEVFVHADDGVYAVYLPDASTTGRLDVGVDATEPTIQWLDPRTGTLSEPSTPTVTGGRLELGAPPSDAGEDWVALIVADGDHIDPPPDGPLAITGFTLIDATTDTDIGPLLDGDVLDFADLGTSTLAVRAEVGPDVASVVFDLDGTTDFQVENVAPYSLHGDSSGDYEGWTPADGDHTVTATGYASADGAGDSGPPLTVTFTVGGDDPPPSGDVYEEVDGLVAVEAEHFSEMDENGTPRAWYITSTTAVPGITPDPDPSHADSAANDAYVEGLPDTRVTHDDTLVAGENFFGSGGDGPILSYRVWFNTTGRYYVRVRAYSTGTEDNGIHVGIDGTWPASGERIQWCTGKNTWTWSGAQRTAEEHCGVENMIWIDVATTGEHIINFSMREDGFEFDRFVLTDDSSYFPTGEGPAERVR